MTEDARFEDARGGALNLGALDLDDLQVISGLSQDAIFPITEMKWQKGARRFALLLNRFRWEDAGAARHAPERVQSVLVIDNVLGVASQGIDRSDPDVILSLLTVTFEPGEDVSGHVLLTLAGDGAIRLEVEALNVTLKDVTRPYVAPSGKAPHHDV
ncbi:Protein of unknown function [Roseovarius nanhaiticus]|uniref:DUF2948 domain-containing protein n=1 Tax=Roseovarius nanhaiticus TaxID=573024 RepID=A0A1N7H4I8_9RHOB|nr:DUF2948 family protein [Roseovarius nanhaiticus]SEL13279.1 Protein of unknown function [Roseovarius nanhaiticus]SIS19756.1 Protein of unknown function [Roseovarius nanhaiticus]